MKGNRTLRLQPITPLQERVAKMLATGSTAKSIGATLGITTTGVEAQIEALYKKANVSNRVLLTHWAIRTGLVELIHLEPPSCAAKSAGMVI